MMSYLDNATTSWPKPDVVRETLAGFLATASGAPIRTGHRLARATWEAVEQARQRLAAFLGVADPRRVVFTASGTDALNLALKGLLGPGDHVVTTALEHDAVRRPLRALEVFGVTTTRVPVGADGTVDPDDVRRALRPNTRLVVVCHASNVTGAIQPVSEIVELAHARGAFVLIDAAQTAGVIPLAIDELGADLVALSGHKWLLGPPGTGALVVGPRIDPSELVPLRDGATGTESPDDAGPRSLPERYETGTLDTIGLAALGAAVDWLARTGLASTGERARVLTERLVAGLTALPGVRLFTPAQAASRVALVSFQVEGWRPLDLARALERDFAILVGAGLHGASEACRSIGAYPCGTVRLSPGWSTSEEEIDRAIAAVATLARAPQCKD